MPTLMRMRINIDMNRMLHIRKQVFGVTQAEMAVIAGTRQATVSRWEAGVLNPDLSHLQRIRDAACERGLEWNDAVFFEPLPAQEAAE